MPQFVIEVVDIYNILKSSTLCKHIMLAKSQRVAADTVVVILEQKLLCGSFVGNVQTARLQNFDLFIQ